MNWIACSRLKPAGLRRVLPLLLAAALPLLAEKVVVTPRGQDFTAGSSALFADSAKDPDAERARFHFQAALEGASSQPLWDWSIVAQDGTTVLADAGSITQEGLYTPPAVSLSKYRLIKVMATALTATRPSGTALVIIRPHQALSPLEKTLGKGWRGERVEVLTTKLRQLPPGKHPGEAAYDSDDDEAPGDPEGASFNHPMAYASWIPWAKPEDRRDRWLVADENRILAVSSNGSLRCIATLEPQDKAKPRIPKFTAMALKPWQSAKDGPWVCYLWDQAGQAIWRLDAQGQASPFVSLKGKATMVTGMAVDRRGTLYVNGTYQPGRKGSYGDEDSDVEVDSDVEEEPKTLVAIYRIEPDGAVAVLAGGAKANRPMDGVGAKVQFRAGMGLALAEDRGCLYVTDTEDIVEAKDDEERALIRTVSLKDGLVTSHPLDPKRFRDDHVECYLQYHRGVLLVSRNTPPALFAVDPATGHCIQVYRDRVSPKDASGWFPRGEVSYTPLAGPCYARARGVPRDKCGSLGYRFLFFSIGPDGEIAFPGGGQMGMLLLDWGDPHSPLGRSGHAGQADGAGREERKEPAATGAGAAPAAGAGREERKEQAVPGTTDKPAAGKAQAGAGAGTAQADAGARAPRIELFYPTSGKPGTLVMVYGQNLQQVDRVLLGTLPIQRFVVGPSGTSLGFWLPAEAPAGTPAPIILGAPAATGGRQWIKSPAAFTVLAP